MSNFIQPCHCLLCPLLPRVLQTVILQCTVEFYVIQSLTQNKTNQLTQNKTVVILNQGSIMRLQ